jgi:hypothetical protein
MPGSCHKARNTLIIYKSGISLWVTSGSVCSRREFSWGGIYFFMLWGLYLRSLIARRSRDMRADRPPRGLGISQSAGAGSWLARRLVS